MNLEQKIQTLIQNEDEGLRDSMSALARVLVINALVHDVSKKDFMEDLGYAWEYYKEQKEKRQK